MRKTIFAAMLMLLLGSLFFSGCRSLEPQAATPPVVLAEFGFPSDAKHILLPIKFQGEEYQFALDTGATNTVFDSTFKDKLGKRFLWPKKGEAAHGKKVKVELFHAPDASLGPLNLKDTRFIVVCDLDQLAVGENRNFQGIVGMEFMKKYIVRIDFDNGKVSFLKGKKNSDLFSFLREKKNEHPEWGEPIPLRTKLFSRLRYIRGRLLDDISAEFMIDSGWQSPGALHSRLYEKVNPDKIVFTIYRGNSRIPVKSDIGLKIIERFSVGPFEYNNNIFQKSNESILGLPFLSRHLVTFDFPNKMMYLKKGKKFDKPLEINILMGDTGCTIIAPGYVVSRVDPNGYAYKQGIREKDVLIKINDHDITPLNVVEFMGLQSQISVPKDGILTFTFKRGDDIIDVSFETSSTGAEKDKTD